ncbi:MULTISPECIES: MFS transporter [Streptomyces]|uniref:MFS transporter n=1 Tax=Streptomyces TaxID=1883 RepID=UPI00081D4834|nr:MULTISPECIES: MFS transporter [Streptomyces]MYU16465.1 MFS transporter [Streptomyces sp. SID8361]ATL86124.1 major facilitator superfamily MFS_1 [Streptomyces malaysiensis]AUA10609.1 putative sulfoacetate transporter SauU [Streptomyces sp. M56]MYX61635.1 MFS transporter [Streptomyces sp. SID8382]QDL70244.1 MFS transporter [Streptomyces malaysiensis]
MPEVSAEPTTPGQEAPRGGWQPYHTLWAMLLGGWLFSYADRTITGPVVTWLIEHDHGMLGSASHPHALGGLIGSLFFAGYMLTQFPGGYLGDRFGHRTMLAVSLLWAGVATLASGLMSGLIAFVVLRVLTGLGEGVFYSNDRSLIAQRTPPAKAGLGMGVAITGLSIGLTIATISAPYLIDWGGEVFGEEDAWRMPFLVLGGATLAFGWATAVYMRRIGGPLKATGSTLRLLGISAVLCAAVMAVYLIADGAGMPSWGVAILECVLAFLLIGAIFARRSGRLGAVSRNRNVLLLSFAFIAVMWNLWFFSFWSVSIVADAAHSSFQNAALVAAFNAGAGILGFPVGGRLSDQAKARGWGRRPLLIAFTVVQGVLVLVFAAYLQTHERPSLWVMSVLLFVTSLFFNALQPMAHALLNDVVDAAERGAAFGLFNLVGEIGAVISPALSGTLFDHYGSWTHAVYIDGALMLVSALLYMLIREHTARAA